ncbi:MAG: glycosyltransferase [Acidobacteriota bacterium]|nr:glycosyltransferase [Acidobacteriota bacterium]
MKLSVVTISLNQARFLPEAIASVHASVQASGGNTVDYVIVDPGSADGSREIVARACGRKPGRFSQALLEPDSGPAEGLNNGFDRCEGEVLGYLNADDRYPPGTLDYVARYFEAHPEKDVLFGAIAIMDETGRFDIRSRVPDRFDARKYAERACNVWCPSTFFRHRAFLRCGGFNPANHTCWDGELAVDLVLSGANPGYSGRVLGEFRIYADSITGSRRLWTQYRADRDRIRRKIYAAGARPYSQLAARALRILYKIDPVRQANYFGWRFPTFS